jgi:hypothetical protein
MGFPRVDRTVVGADHAFAMLTDSTKYVNRAGGSDASTKRREARGTAVFFRHPMADPGPV